MLRKLLLLSCLVLVGIVTRTTAAIDTWSGSQEVIAAFPADFPPQYSLDDNGNPAGFAIDVMNAIAREANIQIRYQSYSNWTETNNALASGKAHLVPNLGITDERWQFADFTSPVETFSVSVFVREDSKNLETLDDLRDRLIGVVSSNVAVKLLQHKNFKLKVFENFSDPLLELLSGRLDAIGAPEPVIWQMAQDAGLADKIRILPPALIEIKRGIGVAKNQPELFKRLDKAASAFVQTQSYQDIYSKWYGKPAPYWTAYRLSLSFAAILVSVIVLMAIWRYLALSRLNRQLAEARDTLEQRVIERTKTLNQFKTSLDLTMDCVFMFDPQTLKFFYTNRGAQQEVGYSAKELLNMTPVDIKPEFDEVRFRSLAEEIINSPSQLKSFTTAHEHKDGHLIPVEVFLQYIKVKNGSPRFIAIVRDITERKQAEETLRKSERNLAVAQKIAHLGSWSLDLVNNRLDWSDENYRIFGTSKKNFKASFESFMILVHPDDREKVSQKYRESIEKGTAYNIDHRIIRQNDGEIRWVQERGQHIRNEQGEVIRSDGTVLDITDRKEAEFLQENYRSELEQQVRERTAELESAKEEAERANREKSRFLANMSHELRTPMHAVNSFSVIGIKKTTDEKARGYFEKIHTSGIRLTHLLDDLLDLSKLEAGKMDVIFHKHNLCKTIQHVLNDVSSLLADKHINIQFAHCDAYESEYDETLIERVVMNLLSNAIKFSQEKSIIEILVDENQEQQSLRVSVIDSGIGIPANEIDDIFDSFVQSTKTMTQAGGTGLGLSICKEIVELHQGKIWAVSPPEGRQTGTVFTFEIPLTQHQ